MAVSTWAVLQTAESQRSGHRIPLERLPGNTDAIVGFKQLHEAGLMLEGDAVVVKGSRVPLANDMHKRSKQAATNEELTANAESAAASAACVKPWSRAVRDLPQSSRTAVPSTALFGTAAAVATPAQPSTGVDAVNLLKGASIKSTSFLGEAAGDSEFDKLDEKPFPISREEVNPSD